MKKIYLIFTFFVFSFAFAQISDSEAKIMYQQAEDAYNNENYLKAFNASQNLMQKMENEPPKLVYLLLKSYAKSLDKGTSSKNYKDLDTYAFLATRFVEKINSPNFNYPAEKAKEVRDIQATLLLLKEQYIGTKDRKPQDAVDFLNECAMKFPYNTGDKVLEENFIIDGSILKITITYIRWDVKFTTVSFIDLSKVTGVKYVLDNSGSHSYFLIGKEINQTDGRNDWTGLLGFVEGGNPNVSADVAFKNWRHTQLQIVGTSKYARFFNPYSAEFQEGNYFERIKDAYQFLIDYFPKTTETPSSNTNKF